MNPNNPMLDDLKSIMKEGYLEKESRLLKSWRRYVDSNNLFFK